MVYLANEVAAAASEPLVFERIDPTQLPAINCFAGRCVLGFEFEQRHFSAEFSLSDIAFGAPLPQGLCTLDWYQLELAGACFFVGLTEVERQQLVNLLGLDEHVIGLPTSLKTSVAQLIFSSVFNAAPEAFSLKTVSWRNLNQMCSEAWLLNVDCTPAVMSMAAADSVSASFYCLCDQRQVPWLQQQPKPSLVSSTERWGHLPLKVRFIKDSTVISSADYFAMQVGDILLLEPVKPNFVSVVVADAWHGSGLMLKSRIILEDDFKPYEHSVSSDESMLQSHIDVHSQKDLRRESMGDFKQEIPIRIEFEAGAIEIPFSKLGELKKGFVFDLSKPLNRLMIVAQGKAIGEGEMVDVGGRAGVRILSLGSESVNTENAETEISTDERAEEPGDFSTPHESEALDQVQPQGLLPQQETEQSDVSADDSIDSDQPESVTS